MDRKTFAIKYAEDFLQECKRYKLSVSKAFLFGSFAKGRSHKYSDIDVAVVSKKFTGNLVKNWHLIFPANKKFPKVEAHLYDPDYFDDGDSFTELIKREGIELQV